MGAKFLTKPTKPKTADVLLPFLSHGTGVRIPVPLPTFARLNCERATVGKPTVAHGLREGCLISELTLANSRELRLPSLAKVFHRSATCPSKRGARRRKRGVRRRKREGGLHSFRNIATRSA